MCTVKTPKVNPASTKAPEPIVIRNQSLDGLDPIAKALRLGRSSLRINRVAPTPVGAAPVPAAQAPAAAVLPPLNLGNQSYSLPSSGRFNGFSGLAFQ